MKRYTFRLEPVLKVRKLKEENCRQELGQLIQQLTKIEDQIRHEQNEIQGYYNIQENVLKAGAGAGQMRMFPMLIEAKQQNIKLLERDRIAQERLIETKKQELAVLRGELKVVENLKEKDYEEYRKSYNKEMDQKVEEQTQNWLQHRDRF